MSALSFSVAEAPRPKPRAGRQGRRSYTPADYKAYEERVGRAAWLAMSAAGVEMMTGPVRIDYVFYLAANRGDLDNYVKGAQDAMNAIVFKDDRQVMIVSAVKVHRKASPALHITVTPLSPDWAAPYQEP